MFRLLMDRFKREGISCNFQLVVLALFAFFSAPALSAEQQSVLSPNLLLSLGFVFFGFIAVVSLKNVLSNWWHIAVLVVVFSLLLSVVEIASGAKLHTFLISGLIITLSAIFPLQPLKNLPNQKTLKTLNLAILLSFIVFASTCFVQVPVAFELVWFGFVLLMSVLTSVRFRMASLAMQNKEPSASVNEDNVQRDAVTNLPSQTQAIKRLRNYASKKKLTEFGFVVIKPVDFIQMNTLLGHQNSDLLLLQLAYCLQQKSENMEQLVNFSNRKSPVRIARLPGLQFLVIVNLHDIEQYKESYIEQVCQSLFSAIPEAISFKSFSLNFDLMFGVDYYHKDSKSVSEVISWASDALLDGESSGNKINYFDHNSLLMSEQQQIRMEQLKQDLADNKLQWQVQPQVDLEQKNLIGFQLQLAWVEQENNAILLTEFIKTAEYSGEIFQLAKMMVEKACAVIIENQKLGIFKPVSISFPSIELLEHSLVEFVAEQIQHHDIDAELLMIEIPESVLLSAQTRAKQVFDQIRHIGVKIALSNFTGSYEGLRYIRKLSVNQLNVDCSQLAYKDDRQVDKVIVNALVNLAQLMEIKLVGTNIDSASVEHVYQEVGGKLGQGNIIIPSMEAKELSAWLTQWKNRK